MRNKAGNKVAYIALVAAILLVGGIVSVVIYKVHKSMTKDTAPESESFISSIADSAADTSGAVASEGSSSEENTSESASESTSESASESASDATSEISGSENAAPTQAPYSLGGNKFASGTLQGDGAEGIKGTGKYNYGEALQKSLLFYELQRSGALPEVTRSNWRGDSCLKDGQDAGLDLTGGWFDAGDNVKFNLPMAYTGAMLGWSVLEDKASYEESNQLSYALGNIRWVNEYFIRCHPSDEVYYYQVGDGNKDHTWWGPAECVEYQMARPSYKVTAQEPGSAVTAETAASLAVCSMVFKDVDPSFSKLCLDHAKSLYAFADKYKSDAGYTAAKDFYNSWSGFYDELAWAGVWLYRATSDEAYLKKAQEYYPKANQDSDWAHCWDDVHIGAALLLAQETSDSQYTGAVQKHLDFWTKGDADGKRVTYTPKGLAWLDQWGALRYATTTAFLAAVYSEWEGCDAGKKDTYWDFAVSQAGYALGDTGFSYQIGFGENYPKHPHHRTSQGSYADNMGTPSESRHILVGALVGGPDASDGYTDQVSDYKLNEVACDYNAGFTGLLAKLYSRYHGQTLTGFGACEEPGDEYKVETSVNASGNDFLEIKALTYNMTAWPARAPKKLELRYFFNTGAKALSALSVKSNYGQNAHIGDLVDAGDNYAYVSVIFDEYSCYPGGQEEYKKEVQFRITGISPDVKDTASVCLYEDGRLVYGNEPSSIPTLPSTPDTTPAPSETRPSGTIETLPSGAVPSDPSEPSTPTDPSKPSESFDPGKPSEPGRSSEFDLTIEYAQGGAANAISGNMTIAYTGKTPLDLEKVSLEYFFTNEKNGKLAFDCYHAAISRKDGKYDAINDVTGSFAKVEPKKEGADTVCTISSFGKGKLETGDKLIVQFSIHHEDWSDFNLSDDYSRKQEDHIVIVADGRILYGLEP